MFAKVLLPAALVGVAEVGAAQAGLCSSTLGRDPVLPETAHDGGVPVQIVDRTFRLPAGTVDSWTLYNFGAAAPITLQVWREVGLRKFALVCTTDAMLKPKLQTILDATGGCAVEEGDNIGWWQPSSAVGGIGIDQDRWDPGCKAAYAKDRNVVCPQCTEAYQGVLWDYPKPAKAAIGEVFAAKGCGPRRYAVSVSVSGECFACAWGCHFLGVVLLGSAIYLVVGMELERRKGAGPSWRDRLPHHTQWLELYGLVQDGWRFAEALRDGRRSTRQRVQTSDGGTEAQQDGSNSGSGGSGSSKKKSKKDSWSSKSKKASKDKSTPASSIPATADLHTPLQADSTTTNIEVGGFGGSREWKPTRSVLQAGARETGVKVGSHTPGQGLRGLS
eukprot:SAG31_NODE_794_length_12043_cov_7.416192_8_plen_388_part_00